jgi:hypothetical protein
MHLHLLARGSSLLLCLALFSAAPAASREVGPGMPLVIPITDVIGGTDLKNNAKNNPNGGYFSVYDSINEFKYPATHGNQLGNTAMVNDHTYWDSAPGGLDATHAPPADPGGGNALWWPIPGEWASYQFTVTTPGSFCVLTRFSSSAGPGQPAQVALSVDGTSSGPIPLTPDDPKLWSDTRYQVGGWWGHTMVSGTSPVAWTLGVGTHVLKVQIEQVSGNPKDHGNLWIHYFKVVAVANAAKAPTAVLKAIVPRQVAAAANTFKQALEHEQKGRLGQALAAYEKALAGSPPGSEQLERATAKAKELRALGEQRLAAAKALPPAEAPAALAQLATEFAGCELGVDAAQAVKAAKVTVPTPAPAAQDSGLVAAVTATWTPPSKAQAVATLKTLISATTAKKPVELSMMMFGKPQPVIVTRADDRAVAVKFAGSTAGLDLLWEYITFSELASLGRACVDVDGRAAQALTVGEACIGLGQNPIAEEMLHLAARIDPTLNAAVAERLNAISPR